MSSNLHVTLAQTYDVTTTKDLLQIAQEVGDHICILKTHADIINDFSDRTIDRLKDIARRKQFLIFEDRKFGDIGNTVKSQYTGGTSMIVRWAHIVNANIFPGPAIITALSQAAQQAIIHYNTSVRTDIRASPTASQVGSADETVNGDDEYEEPDYNSSSEKEDSDLEQDDQRSRKQSVVSVSTTINIVREPISPQPNPRQPLPRDPNGEDDWHDEADCDNSEYAAALENLGPPPFFRSLLLLAQMSSAGNFFTPEYTDACVTQARENRDFVMGFIAQRSLNEQSEDNFITMTPGVQLAAGGDDMGQQYNTPEQVIGRQGSDIIIVGRGILAASDRAKAAAEYRKQGWSAYEARVKMARKQRTASLGKGNTGVK